MSTTTADSDRRQVSDLARRSGLSPSTIRFYERIGLLPAATRTPAGYRLFGDDTVARLAFIGRAKQLGCSLDEIAELLTVWDDGLCAPVQERLRVVVDAKIAEASATVDSLTALIGQLEQARRTLTVHQPDGPCDDRCGCSATAPQDTAAPLPPPVRRPATRSAAFSSTPAPPGPAIACTLAVTEMPGRQRDWQDVLANATERTPIDGGIRVGFGVGADLHELARLVEAESACCAFFRFAITVDARGVALEVRAPDTAADLVHHVFGGAR